MAKKSSGLFIITGVLVALGIGAYIVLSKKATGTLKNINASDFSNASNWTTQIDVTMFKLDSNLIADGDRYNIIGTIESVVYDSVNNFSTVTLSEYIANGFTMTYPFIGDITASFQAGNVVAIGPMTNKLLQGTAGSFSWYLDWVLELIDLASFQSCSKTNPNDVLLCLITSAKYMDASLISKVLR